MSENILQLYADDNKTVKGYPITSAKLVIRENGNSMEDFDKDMTAKHELFEKEAEEKLKEYVDALPSNIKVQKEKPENNNVLWLQPEELLQTPEEVTEAVLNRMTEHESQLADIATINSSQFSSLENAIMSASGKRLLLDNIKITSDKAITIENVDNIKIDGLGLNSLIEFSFEVGARLHFKNCNNLEIRNISIQTSTATERSFINTCGIEVEDCSNVTIENVRINKHTGMGILITSCNNVNVNKNIISNTLADGIHIANSAGKYSNNIYITNNRINDCGDDGIACVGYTHNLGMPNEKIIAYGNTIINSKARGMSCVGGTDIIYHSNIIDGASGSGIIIIQDHVLNENGTIKYSSYKNTNCKFYSNTMKNINKVNGQGFPSIKRPSILIETYKENEVNENIEVYDNLVVDCNHMAFSIRHLKGGKVKNNKFLSCKNNFFTLSNVTDVTISENECTNEDAETLSNVIQFTNINNVKINNNIVNSGVGYGFINGNEVFSNDVEFIGNTIEFNKIANSGIGGLSLGKVNNLKCMNNHLHSINDCAYDINLSNVQGEIILRGNTSKTKNSANTILSSFSPIDKQQVEMFKTIYGLSAPTEGKWKKGDICYNYNPTPSNYIGWICITDGTPGIWKRFGQIEA